jgi:hypothetical protein
MTGPDHEPAAQPKLLLVLKVLKIDLEGKTLNNGSQSFLPCTVSAKCQLGAEQLGAE